MIFGIEAEVLVLGIILGGMLWNIARTIWWRLK